MGGVRAQAGGIGGRFPAGRYISSMKISAYPRILLAALLLTGCSKSSEPQPQTQPQTPPATTSTGTYTDLTGATFPVTNLRAVASAVLAANGTNATIQRINVYGTLADGRELVAGLSIASPTFPTTIGPLPMSDPATEVYYFRVQPPTDTTPAYGVRGQSSGTITQERIGPSMLTGTYRGPLRPANGGPALPNPPYISFAFSHVPLQ